jgi:cystathionine beta-lyase family protein involved in aluminum resistance
MSEIKHYYKKKVVKNNVTAEYNSETETITVQISRGYGLGDWVHLKTKDIEPLYELLKEVSKEVDESDE